MKKIAIFVDVQNIYYTVKQKFNAHFDYNQLWSQVSREGEISKAFAYAIDRGDAKQKQFQNILRGIGFEVKLKPYISRSDGSAKGDWDVGITLDLVEYAKDVDKVIILSGDGDFDLAVDKIKEKFNVEVSVFGVRELTADSLINAADRFVPIEGNLLL
ncbi:MAG: nuclease [Epsilonproteobacteria bacterium]|nr:MAG: nuclease [Campylobacterota bacterium]